MLNPFEALLNKAVLANRPIYGSIELSYTCNMACTFCYNPVQRTGQVRTKPAPQPLRNPLTFEEIVGVLDQLKSLGVLYLTVTGGEALLHPRFWDIMHEAKQRRFAIRLFTNGLAIDEPTADRLAALRPNCLEISIHGADDATAEKLNKVPGSHTRLLSVLEMLKKRELVVYLKCVVTNLVEHQLHEIQSVGDSFGFPVYFDPIITPSDDAQDYPLELQASDQAIRELYSRDGLNIGVSKYERTAGQYNCSLAKGTIHVDPYGNVSPCLQWKEHVGNVRDQSIVELWHSSEELENIRKINLQVNTAMASQTKDEAFCGHCPALSKLRYGNPLQAEEQYLRVARIRSSIYESESPKPTD